jgi:hypothetical protein
VANQPQCKIEFLAVSGVAIVGHSHGGFLGAIHAISG